MINQVDGTDTIVHNNQDYSDEQIESYLSWLGYKIESKKDKNFVAVIDIPEEEGAKFTVEIKEKDGSWYFRGIYSSILYYDEIRRENVYGAVRVFSKSQGNEYLYGWLNLGRVADGLKLKYGK